MSTILRFLFSAIGLLVASAVIPGITHSTFMDLVVVAVILGALNATLGTLLKFLAFIPVVLSFGCFSLVINGFVFWMVGALSGKLGLGFGVSGFWAGFFGALITSLTASILNALFLPKKGQGGGAPPEGPTHIKIINP